MQSFIRHFYREARGRWVCFESCNFQAPIGVIHVSTGTMIHRGYSINDYDLAARMDDEYERQESEHP